MEFIQISFCKRFAALPCLVVYIIFPKESQTNSSLTLNLNFKAVLCNKYKFIIQDLSFQKKAHCQDHF